MDLGQQPNAPYLRNKRSDLSDKSSPELSVVVAVFNEEYTIKVLTAQLDRTIAEITETYEIIFVDDGSSDGTWELVRRIAIENARVRGVSLSRNFGQQQALFAGLQAARGRAVITMDGDLQHPVATIPELIQQWRAGALVVETLRADSEDVGLFKRLSSWMFAKVFSWLSALPMEHGTSEFRLLDRVVVDEICALREVNLFLRGITHWMGYPSARVYYRADQRISGRSKYGLINLLRYSLRSLVGFSLTPLRIGIWVGFVTSMLALSELCYIVFQYTRGHTVPGWASTVTVMSFMFGVMFVLMGIIGVYVGAIFETVKNRPQYLIKEVVG